MRFSARSSKFATVPPDDISDAASLLVSGSEARDNVCGSVNNDCCIVLPSSYIVLSYALLALAASRLRDALGCGSQCYAPAR